MDSNTFNQIITILAVLGALFVVFAIVMAYMSRVFKSCGDITDSLTHGPLLVIGIIFVLVAGGLVVQRYRISPQVSYKQEDGSYGIRLSNSTERQEKPRNNEQTSHEKNQRIPRDNSKKETKTRSLDWDKLLENAHEEISKFFEQSGSEK